VGLGFTCHAGYRRRSRRVSANVAVKATIAFAGLAHAVKDGWGEAQADTLHRVLRVTVAQQAAPDGGRAIPVVGLGAGDRVVDAVLPRYSPIWRGLADWSDERMNS